MSESTERQDTDNQPDEVPNDDALLRIDPSMPASSPTDSHTMPNSPIGRDKMSGPPSGMRRADRNGFGMIDSLAGRATAFGFGFQRHIDAIQATAESYLGDGASPVEPAPLKNDPAVDDQSPLHDLLHQVLADSTGIHLASARLCASADLGVETAIEIARGRTGGSRFRTLALGGSDHGRTGVCRTASGRAHLHEGYGPMMAGFGHVTPGCIDSLRNAIDEQCGAVLLCPINLDDAARPLEASYLQGVRQLCDEHDLLLIIDESRLCIGSTPEAFVFSSIADISADVVIIAGGLLAGLPGAIVLANERASQTQFVDLGQFPLLAAVATETLAEMKRGDFPRSAVDEMQDFAVAIAEHIGSFEFVRDLHATGMTIGIETDIPSAEIVRAAADCGLRVESAGETAIRMQPPIRIDSADRDDMLNRLAVVMEVIERRAADVDLATAGE